MADERLRIKTEVTNLKDLEKAKLLAKELDKYSKKKYKFDISINTTKLDEAEKRLDRINQKAKQKVSKKIQVDNTDLEKSTKKLDELDTKAKKPTTKKVLVDTTGIDQGTNKVNNSAKVVDGYSRRIATSFERVGGVLTGVGSTLNIISAGLQNVGNNMQMIGRLGLIGSTIVGGGILAGATKVAKKGVTSALGVQNVEAQLKAQGIEGQKVNSMMEDMTDYANRSAFSLETLGNGLSAVNSQIGDIDKSYKVVKAFGTSLMATGKSANELGNVAFNLGQLGTGAFGKADYKELLRGVPAMSQALRDIGIDSWEKFNEALGDDPNTRAIERTGNALELVLDAMEKYNKKTNAYEESQKTISAQWENFNGQIETSLSKLVKSSGLQDSLKVMLNNLGEAFEKNKDVIEDFYKWLGKVGIKFSEKIRDFDFKGFFKGLVEGLKETKKEIASFFNGFKKYKSDFGKLFEKFTDGKTGAEGFGKALANIGKGSVALWSGGVLVKGLASVISLLSSGATLAGSMSRGLGNILNSGGLLGGKTAKPISGGATSGGSTSGLGKVGGALKGVLGGAGGLALGVEGFVLISQQLEDLPSMDIIKEGISKLNLMMASFGSLNLSFDIVAKIAGVDRVSGAISNLVNAGSLLIFSKLAKQLEDLPGLGTITKGFAKIGILMGGMQAISLGSAWFSKAKDLDPLSSIFGAISNALNAGTMYALSKSLKSLDDLPGTWTIIKGFLKIGAISIAMGALNTSVGLVSSTPLGIVNLIGAVTNTLNAGSMIALANSLKSLKNLPSHSEIVDGMGKLTFVSRAFEQVEDLLSSKKGFWASLGDTFKSWFKSMETSNLVKIVDHIKTIVTSLEGLNDVNIPSSTKLEEVLKAVGQIAEGLEKDWENVSKRLAKGVGNIASISEDFSKISTSLESLTNKVLPNKNKIDYLQRLISDTLTAIRKITNQEDEESPTKGMNFSKTESIMKSLSETFKNFTEINNELLKIQEATLNTKKLGESVNATVESMKLVLSSLQQTLGSLTLGNNNTITGGMKFNKPTLDFSEMEGMIEKIKGVSTKLSELQQVLVNIQNAQVVADEVKKQMEAMMKSLSNILATFQADTTKTVVNDIKSDAVTGAIEGITKFVETVKQALSEIGNLSPLAATSGTTLKDAVISAFVSDNGSWGKLKQTVENSLKDMNSIGKTKGNDLKQGFDSATINFGSAVLNRIETLKNALASIPRNLSIYIDTNFASIESQINNLSSRANNLRNVVHASNGGAVSYYSKGGSVGLNPFISKGTDKIPAMLTNGEFVQNRNAVSFWGRNLMEALNARNVSRVSQLMQHRIGAINRSYTTNNYTTNSPTVNQTFNSGASNKYLRLNRLVRGV